MKIAPVSLVRKRNRLLREARQRLRENLMRGAVVESARRCGKQTCRCMRGGPAHAKRQLVVTLAGKTRARHLDAEREAAARRAVSNYKRLWALIEELTELNLALLGYSDFAVAPAVDDA